MMVHEKIPFLSNETIHNIASYKGDLQQYRLELVRDRDELQNKIDWADDQINSCGQLLKIVP
ncbi:hypothetical protein LCGC14_0342880 [marine sediment metagenome]|uniref:Uncharacterized protein n=1 Tax=marine sediment metagenome TaxID=412755 RepID=A0A0F9TCT9_9ZZZZ